MIGWLALMRFMPTVMMIMRRLMGGMVQPGLALGANR